MVKSIVKIMLTWVFRFYPSFSLVKVWCNGPQITPTQTSPHKSNSPPGAYCIKLLPEKNGKVNGTSLLTRVFGFYQSFFLGKSFMQWAPDNSHPDKTPQGQLPTRTITIPHQDNFPLVRLTTRTVVPMGIRLALTGDWGVILADSCPGGDLRNRDIPEFPIYYYREIWTHDEITLFSPFFLGQNRDSPY